MLLQAYDQLETAEICYRRSHNLRPGDLRWAYYLATVQVLLRKHAEAAASLREALKLEPHYLPACMQLARSLLETGEPSQSGSAYDAILQLDSRIAEAHYGKGRVLAATGHLNDAIRHYRSACDLAPTYGAAHYALAIALRDMGRRDEAEKEFALYQSKSNGAPELSDPLLEQIEKLKSGDALDHLKRGVRLETAGKLREAAAEQERAIQIDHHLVQAHINLISLYTRLVQMDRAQQHYAEAMKINPDQAELHYNYGLALLAQKRLKEAAGSFRRALEIKPLAAEAHLNLGLALEQQGLDTDAMQHYRAALESRPGYRLAAFRLARAMLVKGQSKESIEFFLTSISPEDEQTPLYMFGLATAYAEAGERKAALSFGRRAKEKALSLRQTGLVAAIDRDLEIWEHSADGR
jgi:tetratricopeptide (TPR) repeat protein